MLGPLSENYGLIKQPPKTYYMSKIRQLWKSYWLASIIAACLLLISFWLHTVNTWSPMSLDDQVWNTKMDLHLNHHPFRLRLFQSHVTNWLHLLTGVSLKITFYTVQYLLAFITGLLFLKYLRRLGFDRFWAHLGMILFFTSLSVLAAHFAPIHTWDDFWMYLLLLLTALSILNSSWYQAAVFFTLGCFARETFLLMYPVLLFFAWRELRFKSIVKLSVCALIPLLIYGSYLMLYGSPPPENSWRFLSYNFENSARAADTTVSIVNAFGFVWLLATAGMVKLSRQARTASQDFCFWGVMLLLPINTIMVAAFALIRETRLLFVPFLFVIPIALWFGQAMWISMRTRHSNVRFLFASLLGTALFLVAGLYLAELIWPVFDYQSSSELRRNVAGINIGLALGSVLFWLLSIAGKSKQITTST